MISRYSSKEIEQIFSPKNKYKNFLKVELSVIEAYVKLGVIPKQDFLKIKQKAVINVDKIDEYELTTKHDVIAFIKSITEQLGAEKKWFHYSLTSSDIVDSAQALSLKQVDQYLENDLQNLKNVLRAKALQYKNVPIIGRTHGMHAEITSFGLKYVLWFDELQRCFARFITEKQYVETIKISGAVGNYANVPCEVEELVAKQLDVQHSLISTQVLSRDRHAGYLFSLASIANLCEKIALEIRHLSRSEVQEVSEEFSQGQKGSSAMPHKKNPIGCENICGCARVMRSYVSIGLENNCLWHERDISHSAPERIILPDAITLLHYMLQRLTKIIDHLVVFPEKMLENIYSNGGVVFSGKVLTKILSKVAISREEVYDLIQKLSFQSLQAKQNFQDLIVRSKIGQWLTKQEIQTCFDVQKSLVNVDKIYQRIFKEGDK